MPEIEQSGWERIVTEELERIKAAAARTQQILLTQEDERLHRELPSRDAAKKQAEFTQDLAFVRQHTVFYLDRFLSHHFPSPLLRINERSAWEVYLSGLRSFLVKFSNSYFAAAVFTMFRLEGFREKLHSYGKEYEIHLPQYYTVCHDLQTFQETFERGESEMRPHKKPDYDLIRSYASYRTWLYDNHFENFASAYQDTCRSAVTLIVEGPFQLYLMIASDHRLAIWKALTAERLGDLFSTEGITDIAHLGAYVQSIVRESRMIPLSITFMKILVNEYLNDWKEDIMHVRAQYSTVEKRQRFLQQFEQGSFFVT